MREGDTDATLRSMVEPLSKFDALFG